MPHTGSGFEELLRPSAQAGKEHDVMNSLQAEMRTFSFGPFVLVPHKQLLAKGPTRVRVGLRCFDILTALVERAGELVTKEELLSRVWPNTFVEESNLKVNVAALRRALGDDSAEPLYVATANGRGYRFIAPVEARQPDPDESSRTTATLHNFPAHTRPVGRDAIVQDLCARVPQRRLVTLAGAGGIGKTTVALAVASQLAASFQQRIFVDLTSVTDPIRAPAAVTGSLHDCDRSQPVLLILDNCEHLVDSVASVTEDLLREASHVHILATSREPLGVKGEQVYRLSSLDTPREEIELKAREALGYPAIELFVERAAACAAYRLCDEDVPVLSELCRSLDGNPLAIELAAARMDSLGLRGLAALMDHRSSLLNLASRTGPPRHRTLAATLHWSYELLSVCEQELLQRLSVLTGAFRLEAAFDASADSLNPSEIAEGLAGLVAKSLLQPEVQEGIANFRLTESTRAFAAQKLAEAEQEAASSWRDAAPARDRFIISELRIPQQLERDWPPSNRLNLDGVPRSAERRSAVSAVTG